MYECTICLYVTDNYRDIIEHFKDVHPEVCLEVFSYHMDKLLYRRLRQKGFIKIIPKRGDSE